MMVIKSIKKSVIEFLIKHVGVMITKAIIDAVLTSGWQKAIPMPAPKTDTKSTPMVGVNNHGIFLTMNNDTIIETILSSNATIYTTRHARYASELKDIIRLNIQKSEAQNPPEMAILRLSSPITSDTRWYCSLVSPI